MTTEQSQIFVSHQYHWNIIIYAEWEDLRRKKSPCDIFICYAHLFQLNLNETCLLCNESELKIICGNDKPANKKLQWFEVFNYSTLGWGRSKCEWYSDISGKGVKGQTWAKRKKLGDQILIATRILCDSKQNSIHGWWDLGKGDESGIPWY